MINTELVGHIAAFLTTSAFLVQAIKSFRTKDLSGISLGMYFIFALGVALWLSYGIALNNWPLILANSFTLTFALCILIMKIKQNSIAKKLYYVRNNINRYG